jgi:hypothetical protein
MGSFGFRRTVSLGGGFRLNANKRSVGIGGRVGGARWSFSSEGGSTRSVDVPGSGLDWRSQTDPRRRRRLPDGSLAVDASSKAGTVFAAVVVVAFVVVVVAIVIVAAH